MTRQVATPGGLSLARNVAARLSVLIYFSAGIEAWAWLSEHEKIRLWAFNA